MFWKRGERWMLCGLDIRPQSWLKSWHQKHTVPPVLFEIPVAHKWGLWFIKNMRGAPTVWSSFAFCDRMLSSPVSSHFYPGCMLTLPSPCSGKNRLKWRSLYRSKPPKSGRCGRMRAIGRKGLQTEAVDWCFSQWGRGFRPQSGLLLC